MKLHSRYTGKYSVWTMFRTVIELYDGDDLSEAVAIGRVKAPGFFEDPTIKAAWLKAEWIGPSQGMLDPVKEIQAEKMACDYGFSTHADSALRLNGSDYNSNIEQLSREADKVREFMGSPEDMEENSEIPDNPEENES